MNESLNMLILNSASAPQINWVMVIAGVLLLGFSLFMFFKLRK
ncbi:LPXTG cell wall anchor domain-containing protein [Jeotgalicoccus psychrophilus]|nr:LPXTG cell wall anchor domain-containing protein [Jeotgalicoccus psychrophilus]